MTDLLILGGSAIVVAMIVAAVWAMGFRDQVKLDCEGALAAVLKDFAPDASLAACAVDANGRAALGRLTDGRVAAAVAMGADVTVRIFQPGRVKVRVGKKKAVVRFADLGFPPIRITYPEQTPPALLTELSAMRRKRK